MTEMCSKNIENQKCVNRALMAKLKLD